MERIEYDVLVVGAGVTGCAIARMLSKYTFSVGVVEAGGDVANGASRANSGIVHSGYDAPPGTLMARLNVRGNAMYDTWCKELSVPLNRCGSLVLAFDEQDEQHLRKLMDYGKANGVPDIHLISGGEARAMEPVIAPEVLSALYAPTCGITCPYEMTIACAENAAANGVEFHLDWPVTAIAKEENGLCIFSGERRIYTKILVNAAGVHTDDIARMLGDASFSIQARRGAYLLMDREAGAFTSTVLFQTPSPMGKGVLVSPTIDGNLFAGPSATDQEDKQDASADAGGLDVIRKMALRTAKDIPWGKVITVFAGVRAVADTGDFILRVSEAEPRLLHAAGISSPGLSSAPAIAEMMEGMVVEALAKDGLAPEIKPGWRAEREGIPHFRTMTEEQRKEAIARDPRYARMICRCETVTEAEIVEAIHRVPGARSVDAVKRRTRAGMGRCQGGFCAPRVMELLSRELGIPMEQVTKNGGASYMVTGKLRASDES